MFVQPFTSNLISIVGAKLNRPGCLGPDTYAVLLCTQTLSLFNSNMLHCFSMRSHRPWEFPSKTNGYHTADARALISCMYTGHVCTALIETGSSHTYTRSHTCLGLNQISYLGWDDSVYTFCTSIRKQRENIGIHFLIDLCLIINFLPSVRNTDWTYLENYIMF